MCLHNPYKFDYLIRDLRRMCDKDVTRQNIFMNVFLSDHIEPVSSEPKWTAAKFASMLASQRWLVQTASPENPRPAPPASLNVLRGAPQALETLEPSIAQTFFDCLALQSQRAMSAPNFMSLQWNLNGPMLKGKVLIYDYDL